MEALGFNNILGADEIDNLFSDPEETQPEETGSKQEDNQKKSSDDSEENDETKEKLTKLQQKNVHADSTPDSDKQKEEQAKSLNDMVRSFM